LPRQNSIHILMKREILCLQKKKKTKRKIFNRQDFFSYFLIIICLSKGFPG
jgi:hypothetical protein